jgi:hypothetical protein
MIARHISTSFRGAPTGPRKARPDDRLRVNYDVQLHIGGSRDSGSGPSDHPGMTQDTFA